MSTTEQAFKELEAITEYVRDNNAIATHVAWPRLSTCTTETIDEALRRADTITRIAGDGTRGPFVHSETVALRASALRACLTPVVTKKKESK